MNFQNKTFSKEREISLPVVREIEDRLKFMLDVGLDYLELSRKANTLSGGSPKNTSRFSTWLQKLVGADTY